MFSGNQVPSQNRNLITSLIILTSPLNHGAMGERGRYRVILFPHPRTGHSCRGQQLSWGPHIRQPSWSNQNVGTELPHSTAGLCLPTLFGHEWVRMTIFGLRRGVLEIHTYKLMEMFSQENTFKAPAFEMTLEFGCYHPNQQQRPSCPLRSQRKIICSASDLNELLLQLAKYQATGSTEGPQVHCKKS